MIRQTTTSTVAPARKRWSLTALFTAALLFLAGCGAQVGSELEIQEDLSGTRTIVATIAEEDVEQMTGGVEAAEAAIEAHLPAELTFDGINAAGSSADTEDEAGATDGYEAVFSLEFSDAEEYQTKAQSLIDLYVDQANEQRDSSLSEVTGKTAEVSIVNSEGPLLVGFVLEENFNGVDLLDWVAYALYEDEVITEENINNVISGTSGSSRVLFGGEEYDISEPFSINEAEDQRFSDVSVDIAAEGTTVSIASALHYGDYDTGIELAEEYLDSTGMDYSTTDNGRWEINLDESADLQEQLRTLLDNENLTVETQETASTDDATLVTTMTGSNFSCDSVCQYLPSIAVHSSESLTVLDSQQDGDSFTLSYERRVPLEQLNIETDVTFTGDIGQTYRYSVANEHAESFGGDLETVFAPPEDAGSISTEEGDGVTIYVATLDPTDPDSLNQVLESYMPNSSVQVWGLEDFSVWPTYSVEVMSFGAETYGTMPTQSLNLPVMHSLKADESDVIGEDLTAQDSYYWATISGPTLGGIILVGGLLILAVIIVIVVVRYRKKIAAGLRSAQTQAQTMAQTANANWQATQQQQAAAAGQADQDMATMVVDQPVGPVDDATWQAQFTENKLQ